MEWVAEGFPGGHGESMPQCGRSRSDPSSEDALVKGQQNSLQYSFLRIPWRGSLKSYSIWDHKELVRWSD